MHSIGKFSDFPSSVIMLIAVPSNSLTDLVAIENGTECVKLKFFYSLDGLNCPTEQVEVHMKLHPLSLMQLIAFFSWTSSSYLLVDSYHIYDHPQNIIKPTQHYFAKFCFKIVSKVP